jgi:phosphopantothenoylcysteine decarboxylase/phosphopantothenate--cysteine ligase
VSASSRKETPPHILVTAGPTREKIDPIRFISNYSTGIFGYELAREAKRRGACVVLVSGPTALKAPRGVRLLRVESAVEMERAVLREFPRADCVIMTAAVSDWRVKSVARKKIKRSSGKMTVNLVENPDILKSLGKRKKKGKFLVGFALETGNLARNALRKLREKNLDMIVANKIAPRSSVFGPRAIDVLIADSSGRKRRYFGKEKSQLAKIILDNIFNRHI